MENNDNNSIMGIRNMGNKLSFVLSFVKIKRLKTNSPNVARAKDQGSTQIRLLKKVVIRAYPRKDIVRGLKYLKT